MGLQAKIVPEIRAELGRAGITRKALARQMEWNPVKVYRKLHSETPITLDELGEMAAALGLQVEIRLVPISTSTAPSDLTSSQVMAHILDEVAA